MRRFWNHYSFSQRNPEFWNKYLYPFGRNGQITIIFYRRRHLNHKRRLSWTKNKSVVQFIAILNDVISNKENETKLHIGTFRKGIHFSSIICVQQKFHSLFHTDDTYRWQRTRPLEWSHVECQESILKILQFTWKIWSVR